MGDKMKAMISQPMKVLTPSQINNDRERAICALKEKSYEIVNTIFKYEWDNSLDIKPIEVVNIPLFFLSKVIEAMSHCEAVFFVKGWEKHRGCKIEHAIAQAYGLEIIEE